MPRPLTAPSPTAVTVLTRDDGPGQVALESSAGWEVPDVLVALTHRGTALEISVRADGPVARVALRFEHPIPEHALVAGDAWERAYGDLHWGPQRPERVLPWYWTWYDEIAGTGGGMGVALRPGAFCSWTVDGAGATLWLDLHNGGEPVLLGDRSLAAATVVATACAGSPGDVVDELCEVMATDVQLRPIGPVIGANNWYHAYGEGFDPEAVLQDADTITSLSPDDYRPFSVVDAGWARGGAAHGGPWATGIPGLFDDMGALAERVTEVGARPGLWLRPAALSLPFPGLVERPGPRPSPSHRPLDLTVEENLLAVENAVATITGGWGYQLIKHDFTFYDLLGRHGRQLDGIALTEPGWHHTDRSLTNAEILRGLYDRIRAAAGSAVVLGCGTPGHLAAGSIDVQRTGCDTSGVHWERTRRMGVNALAFRQSHDRRLYVCDPDCVPSTPATPWAKNRQFLDAVARSGSALFVSIDPSTRTTAIDDDVRAAVARSLAVQAELSTAARAQDLLTTSSPRTWQAAAGERVSYDWLDPIGAWPLPVR